MDEATAVQKAAEKAYASGCTGSKASAKCKTLQRAVDDAKKVLAKAKTDDDSTSSSKASTASDDTDTPESSESNGQKKTKPDGSTGADNSDSNTAVIIAIIAVVLILAVVVVGAVVYVSNSNAQARAATPGQAFSNPMYDTAGAPNSNAKHGLQLTDNGGAQQTGGYADVAANNGGGYMDIAPGIGGDDSEDV